MWATVSLLISSARIAPLTGVLLFPEVDDVCKDASSRGIMGAENVKQYLKRSQATMARTKEKFVVNSRGKRVSVLVDIEEYQAMLRDLEELESIRAYDQAKESGDEAIPFEQAISEIEERR